MSEGTDVLRTWDRLREVETELDTLRNDIIAFSGRIGPYPTRNVRRHIDRVVNAYDAVLDAYRKDVLKVSPTAKLDRQYEKDLS
jgi:hypothetical protein